MDRHTGDPIPGVAVALVTRGSGVQQGFEFETDSAGGFTVPSISVGSYRLELRHFGYNSEVGDFSVVRAGGFVVSMQPVVHGDDELLTGIVGVLTDAATGDRISGVAVRTGQGQAGTFTDRRGEFLFHKLVPGRHVVEFAMMGYAPRADTIRVAAGRVTNVRASLSVDPVALEPIKVSVERREFKLQKVGFYERRDLGFGRYIDRQDIENRGPLEVTDLFAGMPGVELFTPRGGSLLNPVNKYVVLRSGRVMWPSRTISEEEREEREYAHNMMKDPEYYRCFPAVYVDDFRTHQGGEEPARLDELLSPMDIAGIEVYPSTTGLPPKYLSLGARCGVIVVWTREAARGDRTPRRE